MEIIKDGIKHVGSPAELKEYFGEKKAKKKEPTFGESANALMSVTSFDSLPAMRKKTKKRKKKNGKRKGRKRKNHNKKWTTAKEIQLRRMKRAGMNNEAIAKKMHRTVNSVTSRAWKIKREHR